MGTSTWRIQNQCCFVNVKKMAWQFQHGQACTKDKGYVVAPDQLQAPTIKTLQSAGMAKVQQSEVELNSAL
jgi:hypothetical protein